MTMSFTRILGPALCKLLSSIEQKKKRNDLRRDKIES